VVFFVDGIPVGVDNQSPYTLLWNTAGLASGTQHTIEARACALYASKRLTESDRVTISVGAAGVRPAPPTNLRIISATAQ
jgi:hypothetical protein